MEIIPVLDLLNGIVVRGIAGRRSEYQPLHSSLTDSRQPLDVARALRSAFGFVRFYVADLDAILYGRGRVNWDAYRNLIDDGFELQIDAGIRDADLANQICNAGAQPIVGLESCDSPMVLSQIAIRTRGDLTFSLDLIDGQPKFGAESKAWSVEPLQVARQAVHSGVERIIVLDLADVGTSSGGRTADLCRSILKEFPRLRLVCGGGVRGLQDLLLFKSIGLSAVLVASSLHDGHLTRAQIHSACQL